MSNNELVRIISSEYNDEEKRQQLISSTANNQDNHTAWIIHIKNVVQEDDDKILVNEELTSRYNAINIIPKTVNIQGEDDVVIVEKPVNTKSIFSRMKEILGFGKSKMD